MLKWHRRLATKVTAIGLAFLVILVAILWVYYEKNREILKRLNSENAAMIGEIVNTAILQFVMLSPEGGANIDKFLPRLNAGIGDASIKIIQSESINVQYGMEEGEEEWPLNEHEKNSLADGKPRRLKTDDYFAYISPIKAREECRRCHAMPDGSGKDIPVDYVIGLAVAKVPTDAMNAQLASLFNQSVELVLLTAALLLVQSLVLNRLITRPIGKVHHAIGRVTDGYLEERVDVRQRDELGSMAENFNFMADALQQSIESMKKWNENLKAEVARQTEEIRGHAEKISDMRDYYRSIIDSSRSVIYTTDLDFNIDSVSAEWDKMAAVTGIELKSGEILGKNMLGYFSPEAAAKYRETCAAILESRQKSGKTLYSEEFSAEINGEKKYFDVSVAPLVDSKDNVVGFVFASSDISERKRAEELLRVEKEKLNAIMNGMGSPLQIIDEDFRVDYMNRLMEETFGKNIKGKKCFSVVAGTDSPCEKCAEWDLKSVVSHEVEGLNGRVYLCTLSPVVDEKGKLLRVEVFKDITYLKRMEEQLRELSITDNLTGLFNKRHFVQKLNEEMIRAQRHGHSLVLMFLDIDKFKHYNDTYGHVEGDVVLAELGRIIRECIRGHVDAGFRYGGEEFTVILPETDVPSARLVAERIRNTFKETRFTPKPNGSPVDVHKTVSIGLSLLKKDDDVMSFIDRADVSMYYAKRSGGDRIEVSE